MTIIINLRSLLDGVLLFAVAGMFIAQELQGFKLEGLNLDIYNSWAVVITGYLFEILNTNQASVR